MCKLWRSFRRADLRGVRPRRLAALAGLLLAPAPLQAQITYTWIGGSSHWGNPEAWDTLQAPNDPSGLVVITLPATVYLGGYDVWGEVGEVGADAATLTVGPDSEIYFGVYGRLNVWGGSIVNDGAIRVIPYDAPSWGSASLWCWSPTTITGSGTIRLEVNDNINNFASLVGAATVNSAGHSISGTGDVQCALDNQGLVQADVPGAPLQLWTDDKSNSGIMRAANGGILALVGQMEVDNTGGLIEAVGADSRVRFSGVTVRGGQLAASDAGVLEVAIHALGSHLTLDTPTISGDLVVRFGQTLFLEGATYLQNGTTRIENGSLVIRDPATAISGFGGAPGAGGGEVVMGCVFPNGISGEEPGNVLTLANDFTLRGRGGMSVGLVNLGQVLADDPSGEWMRLQATPKSNAGLMQAVNGGTLWFDAVAVENSGTIDASSGPVSLTFCVLTQTETGMLTAQPAGAIDCTWTTIIGGTIDVPAGPQMSWYAPTFDGVTNQGTIDALGGTIRNSITNNGTIGVPDPGGFNSNAIKFDGDATLTGNGRVVMDNITYCSIQPTSPASTLTNGPEHTLAGRGVLYGICLNQGILAPGDDATPGNEIGAINLIQDITTFTCEPTSVVRIQVSGIGAGAFDKIGTSGGANTFSCAGTLVIEHLSGFEGPQIGEFIDVVTTGSVIGEFDQVVAPALTGDREYQVEYLSDRVRVIVAEVCVGDIDGSGGVGFNDLVAILSAWGPCVGDCPADLDGSGDVGFNDLIIALSAWGPC